MENFHFRDERGTEISIEVNESIISILFKIFINLTNDQSDINHQISLLLSLINKDDTQCDEIYTLPQMIGALLRKFKVNSFACEDLLASLVKEHTGQNLQQTSEQKSARMVAARRARAAAMKQKMMEKMKKDQDLFKNEHFADLEEIDDSSVDVPLCCACRLPGDEQSLYYMAQITNSTSMSSRLPGLDERHLVDYQDSESKKAKAAEMTFGNVTNFKNKLPPLETAGII